MNININNYELVALKKKDRVYHTETGKDIPYVDYYIEFKRKDSPLIMTAKVNKLFRHYVEIEDEPNDGEEIAVRFGSDNFED